MTKTEKRLDRWTEKMEIIDGVVVRYLKPPQQCRPKKTAKIAKKREKSTTEGTKSTGGFMKLITKAIEKKLPSLASAENQSMEDLIAIVQFFHPLLPWKWSVFGGNKINNDDYKFYGMVFNSNCPNGELGYFTLSQLRTIVVPFGPVNFKVERDKMFKPTPATKLTL